MTDLDNILGDIIGSSNAWHKVISRHHEYRKVMIELSMYISEGMESYLKAHGKTDDFTLRFEDHGTVELHCNGDLFNLEQIGDFCDKFNLELIINNRTVVENHLEDRTDVRTRYLFSTKRLQEDN